MVDANQIHSLFYFLQSIFSLIATTQGRLAALYPALILTISNISPYLINLGVTTASKLTTLFHSMSSPSFLMAEENNFQLTCYLLEIFNNIINYQYAENPNLIYAIVLHHGYFEKLDKLTLTTAVAEVERIRLLRENRTSLDEPQKTSTEKTDAQVDQPIEATGSKSTETKDDDPEPAQPQSEANGEDNRSQDEDKKPHKASYAEVAATPVVVDTTKTAEQQEKDGTVRHDSGNNDSSSSSSSSESNNQSETTVAQTNIRPTRNGFVPLEPWMNYWKSKLPLGTVLALVDYLVPQVEEKCGAGMDLEALMEFLKTVQVDSVLPEDGKSIFIRKFQWGEALVIWFRSMMWGQNYVSSMKDYGPWNGTQVKLFQIKQE